MTVSEIEPGIVFSTHDHNGFFIKLHPDQPYFNKPSGPYLITMPTNGCSNVIMRSDTVVFILKDGDKKGSLKTGYEVKKTMFTDIHGKKLWEEHGSFSKLYAVGQTLIANNITFRVKRVAILNNLQIVNVEER